MIRREKKGLGKSVFNNHSVRPPNITKMTKRFEKPLCENAYLTFHMNKLSMISLVGRLICRLCNLSPEQLTNTSPCPLTQCIHFVNTF